MKDIVVMILTQLNGLVQEKKWASVAVVASFLAGLCCGWYWL